MERGKRVCNRCNKAKLYCEFRPKAKRCKQCQEFVQIGSMRNSADLTGVWQGPVLDSYVDDSTGYVVKVIPAGYGFGR